MHSMMTQRGRMASTAAQAAPGGAFVKASFTKAWLSDPGAYPVMLILSCALAGCTAFMTYKITQDPSVRVTKNHKNHVIRQFQ
jgi:NADH-ubiquinone reductase complex 1 MLRQ subunit